MGRENEKAFVSGLVQLLEAKALSKLERLRISTGGITNHLFTRLIKGMSRITSLYVRFSQDAFKMDFAGLQPTFRISEPC
jgi:hypothetical protein